MKHLAVILALLTPACMTEEGQTPRQAANQRALVEARPVGEAQDCVQINRIRTTRVRDAQTIDFEMIDGSILRNRLPFACPGLRFEERFSYRTSLPRLCSVDTITVLQSDGRRGASCGLGQFQPVELPRR
ncbi:hypothetical protein [Sphingosinicella terrae]|uniref:hypothetical protein n=1 Tax=Sphingosinicella terrae TaxID=2172047 RepID=UPI000E0D059B|nr:hypothetical protein [Sphingosinicella terrae]